MTALADLLTLLRTADAPHEVFGLPTAEAERAVNRRYRELAALAHPDRHPAEWETAAEVFKLLQAWRAAARRQLAAGVYGQAARIDVVGRLGRYVGYVPPIPGDLADLYPVVADGTELLLKVARHPAHNDLLRREATALRQLDDAWRGQPVRAHFPTLVETFVLRDGSGAERFTNVLRREQGTLTWTAVRRAYPQGVPAADAAWMFNRLLAALGAAHDSGLVHGAIALDHLLIRPDDHNGILLDWCYSASADNPAGPWPHAAPPTGAYLPPEAAAGGPLTPAADIYAAAACLQALLGDAAPRPIAALLRACRLPNPHRRPHSAWSVLDDFRAILERLYGPPVFRPFRGAGGRETGTEIPC